MPRPIRILLPEASSLSAREAITTLGLAGYQVEICDPDPFPIGRFSRFVSRYHRCPGIGSDPLGYLSFILDLLQRERFDVLLPTHEQGLLFSKAQVQLARYTGLALPGFETYALVHNKAGFSRLLSELRLPQPRTTLLATAGELLARRDLPLAIKMAVGTASRAVWLVRDRAALEQAAAELEACEAFNDSVLVQEMVEGPLERAQAVFSKGKLVGLHGYRQILEGAGGGDAIKESVRRRAVRPQLEQLGERLNWHGALSVDYILRDDAPCYIDCNPRLVEPVNAWLSEVDLAGLLVRVSLGESPAPAVESRAGVRTHLGILAMLGCAVRGGSRRKLLDECARMLRRRGPYLGSREELTPLRWDWMSGFAAAVVAARLFARPASAAHIARTTALSHQLNPRSIQIIREQV
jgi:predicted ATP-grasp superfamily ATP-dependent carboligase